MNVRTVFHALFLLIGGTAAAQPAPMSVPENAWTVNAPVVSDYMFRGLRLGGPSFQPSVEYTHGGLNAGVWTSFPLRDRVPGQSNPEIDVYGAFRFVGDRSFSWQLGFTWYTYPAAKPSGGFYRSTFEPNVAVNYTVGGLTLTPKLYYDFQREGPTAEVNAIYAVPLKQIGSELDFVATLGTYRWDDARARAVPNVKNWGEFWLVGVTLPFQISATGKLAAGISYTEGSGNYLKSGTAPKSAHPHARGRAVVTLGYSRTF